MPVPTTEPGPSGEPPVASAPSKAPHRVTHELVAVYEPTRKVPPLLPYFRGVRERWPFMWSQARSDLKAENYNSVLGQVWLILNPLLLAAVFVFGRSVLRPLGDPAQRDFLIAHLVGALFFYQYVVSAWADGSKSITTNRGMILNSSFPRAVYPFSTAIRSFLEFIPLLIALFATRALLQQPFGWSMLTMPLVIALLAAFALGLSMGSAAIMVFFPDFSNLIALITRLWLWATPILYTTAEIPENLQPYLEWNPLYPFYAALEQIWAGDWPSVSYLLWAGAWSLVTLVGGAWFFLTREREFAVRL